MSLLQKAVETYDAHASLAGEVKKTNQTGVDGKAVKAYQPLAPIGHTITSADIEITLDGEGRFRQARQVDRKEPKIIIPVTEDSAGRTSTPAAHPLCEQVGYLSGRDEKKFTLYVEQLREWEESEFSHPMLRPILRYVEGRTLLADLAASGIEKVDDKQLVRWRVMGLGLEDGGDCWDNQALFRAFVQNQRAVNILFSGSRQGVFANSIEQGLRRRIAELDPTFSMDPRRGIVLSFCVQGCFYAFTNNNGRMDEAKLVALLAETAKAAQEIGL